MKKETIALVLLGALAVGCDSDSDAGTTAVDVVAGDTAGDDAGGTLAGFEVVVPGGVREARAFTLKVHAQGAEGGGLTTWAGEVALSVDRGAVEPSTITLSGGEGSIDARLLREGSVVLTLTGAGVTSTATIDVAPMAWDREPAQDAAAKAGGIGSWRFAGWHGVSVVDDGPELVAVFATGAAATTDGIGDVLGLGSSKDGGFTWTVDPEYAVLVPADFDADGLANPQLVKDSTGLWHLWLETLYVEGGPGSGGTVTHGIRHATSTDGRAFVSDDCPLLGVNAFGSWTSEGVGGPHAVLLDDGSFALWFTGWSKEVDGDVARVGRAEVRTGPGCAESLKGGAIAVERGGKTSWNELRSFSPAVWRDGPVWRMLFAGMSRVDSSPAIGYATSGDGVSWEVSPGGPVLVHSVWDGQGDLSPSVASLGASGVGLFFEGMASLDERSRLGRAVPRP